MPNSAKAKVLLPTFKKMLYDCVYVNLSFPKYVKLSAILFASMKYAHTCFFKWKKMAIMHTQVAVF
jgi:hypothetical protein